MTYPTSLPCLPLEVNPLVFFPKGLQQMDVTHIPCFEKWAFVHLCVDTCSYVIWASARTREVAKDVLQHLFAYFDVIGMACAIKTDNAPAYSSKDGTTHNGLGTLPSAKKMPYRLSR